MHIQHQPFLEHGDGPIVSQFENILFSSFVILWWSLLLLDDIDRRFFFFFFSIFEEHGIPYSYLYIITKMPELMPGLHNHTWSAGIFLLWLWWCYLVPWKRLFTWMDEHKHHFNSWMCVEYLWPVYWCEPYSTQMTIVMIKVSSVFSAWCWHQLES